MTNDFAALREAEHRSNRLVRASVGHPDWEIYISRTKHPKYGVEALLDAYDAVCRERDEARAEARRLREALCAYGEHPDDCKSIFVHSRHPAVDDAACDCGLRAALEGNPE